MRNHHRQSNSRFTKALLEEAVSLSLNFSDLLKKLGVNYSSSMHSYIKRKVEENDISYSHFVGRPRTSPKNKQTSGDVLTFDPGRWKRLEPGRIRAAMIESGVPYVCSECGTKPEWMGKPLKIQVDHRDGNWRDSRPENVRFLCPNCHSQTPTHSVSRSEFKNFGKGYKSVEVICGGCRNPFTTKPFRVNAAKRDGKVLFCSPKCVADKHRRVSKEEVRSAMKELGSFAAVSEKLGVSTITVRRKLKE